MKEKQDELDKLLAAMTCESPEDSTVSSSFMDSHASDADVSESPSPPNHNDYETEHFYWEISPSNEEEESTQNLSAESES
jgi:hypothetical protein